MTDISKLATWFAGEDTGISSKTLAAYSFMKEKNQLRHGRALWRGISHMPK